MAPITPESLASSGSEHGHQSALFCWAQQNFDLIPRLRFMFAIPNGGLREKVTASRLKAEGVRRGVPDIFLPISNPPIYHGLFIEMKIHPNKPTAEQIQWARDLTKLGYKCVVCYTWYQARDEIMQYLH